MLPLWPLPSVWVAGDDGGYSNDLLEECLEEFDACYDDPNCTECLENSDVAETCDEDGTTCSAFANYVCCSVGDSCSDDALLVAFAGER